MNPALVISTAVFMIVSMTAVTTLAGYTLSRTMRAEPPSDDDDE